MSYFVLRNQLVIAAEGIRLSFVKGITFELDKNTWKGTLPSMFFVVGHVREKM